ncbi:MAG: valine--tRNA ligase [Parcubacteria group bacterium]
METRFDHNAAEGKIYESWEKSGFFNPDNLSGLGKPFTIIMPPPNANGSLHIGHALFVTLEDIMTRYYRMRGRKALWLPGADHAGFETQVVYNKKLEKEGRSFWEIPKSDLYNEIKKFTLANKQYMESQLRQLGASCDWSREKFTLDEDVKSVVYETFKQLYEDGLIYRAKRPVNWCVKHQTTLSDLEIKHEDRADKLYYIRYPLQNSDGFIEVATVRPETIPADVAIAVHPKSRWKFFVGKNVLNPLTKKSIPVISDASVDPAFGTGALKITPYHDSADFVIWMNHQNDIPSEPISVIDQYGKLTDEAGAELAGLKVKDAREKSLKLLGDNLLKEEDYSHQVAVCYKCGTIIEPRVMMQWFVKMTEKSKKGGSSLRDLALKSVKSKQIKIVPSRFGKILIHWLTNLRDWNISRQIVWGIRIPVWYCDKGDIVVSDSRPEKCPHCGSKNLKAEEDVFDTWFSSGQWPFATLMTTKTGDFKRFYPTNVMETGWDILPFWVMRMIMFGIYRTGKIPFKTVYLHGLVRDKDRQKMSKSKGNVINPLEVAEVYGTDALRMSLIVGNAAGNDPVISDDKIRGYRNFTTKIWNAARFVLMDYAKSDVKPKFTVRDRKNIHDMESAKEKVARLIESFDFNHAAEVAYHYFWHTFADKVIEEAKPRLKSADERDAIAVRETLVTILFGSLKMLHPFMPFVTEAIYQELPKKVRSKEFLMIENWR